MSEVGVVRARNSDNDAALTAQFGGEGVTEAASATRDEGNFLGEIKCTTHVCL
jgi:hypothetical protein